MAKFSEKTKRVLNSLIEGKDPVDTPDDDSLPQSTAKRDAAKARHVSMEQLALIIDRDPNTIRNWIKKEELPYVMKADRDLGKAWVFDTAEVVRWMERRAADAVAQKLGGATDGMTTEAEAKRRRAVAAAITAELELAELLQSVVRHSVVEGRVTSDYAELRARLAGVADAVAGHIDAAYAAIVRKEVASQLNSALSVLKFDRELKAPAEDKKGVPDGAA